VRRGLLLSSWILAYDARVQLPQSEVASGQKSFATKGSQSSFRRHPIKETSRISACIPQFATLTYYSCCRRYQVPNDPRSPGRSSHELCRQLRCQECVYLPTPTRPTLMKRHSISLLPSITVSHLLPPSPGTRFLSQTFTSSPSSVSVRDSTDSLLLLLAIWSWLP